MIGRAYTIPGARGAQVQLCAAHAKARTDAGQQLETPLVDNVRWLAAVTGRAGELAPECHDCAAASAPATS